MLKPLKSFFQTPEMNCPTVAVYLSTLCCFFLTLLLALESYAQTSEGKTDVIVTIDYCYIRPNIIYTKIDGIEVGIKRIMDISEENAIVPTFFLSPYDYKSKGEEYIKEIALYIYQRGGDLQLHTHPGPLYDEKRPDLFQYSLEEQIEIIRHGKEKIFEWTGETPIAHRAGDYGADENTLKALAANQIFFDSSSFFRNSSSKISRLPLPINALGKKQDVVQVPVSVYKLNETAEIWGYELQPMTRIRKVDIDWADYDQLTSSIAQLQQSGVNTITLFMHFHSFLKPPHDISLKKTKADIVDIEEYDNILKWLNQQPERYSVISFKHFIEKYERNEIKISKKDFLPLYEKKISLIKYTRKKLGINRDNYKAYLLLSVILFIFLSTLFFYMVRKRNLFKCKKT